MKKATGYTGSAPGPKDPARDSDAWFTPAVYIEAARRVLGGIHLDPFSCAHAQQTVKAARFLTRADDALSPDAMWAGWSDAAQRGGWVRREAHTRRCGG